MLIYSQTTGRLTKFGKPAELVGTGYAGKGARKNNAAAQGQVGVGPSPRGFWRIGSPYNSANTGPFTIPVYKLDNAPADDVDAVTGRSAFRIHGDSASRPGDASRGCIILPRPVREAVIRNGSEILWVVE